MILLSSIFTQAQTKTDTIKVKGNCDHCIERVEGVTAAIPGVSQTKMDIIKGRVVITYDQSKTNNAAIQQAIAKAGHDTENNRANDKDYKALPPCCKYERDPLSAKANNLKVMNFIIEGMTCEMGCAKGIESTLYKQKGVKLSEVNYDTKKAKVVYDSTKISESTIITLVENFKPENGEINHYKVVILE